MRAENPVPGGEPFTDIAIENLLQQPLKPAAVLHKARHQKIMHSVV